MLNAQEPTVSPPMREAQQLLMRLFPDGYLLIAHHEGPLIEVTACDPSSGNGSMRHILNHLSDWIQSEKVGKILASGTEVMDGDGNQLNHNDGGNGNGNGAGGRGANA